MFGRLNELFSHKGRPQGPSAETGSDSDGVVLPLDGLSDEYYSWLLGVNSPIEAPLNELESRTLAELELQAGNVGAVVERLPRLPDVLPRLMRALRDERASWEEIADIVGEDATLVVEVLRLANSPCFRSAAKVTCLEQVVMQLGVVGLREVVITVSLKPLMRFEGRHYFAHAGQRIWKQALSAAVACRSLAVSRQMNRFEAYLAGLVHNVGMVVVMQVLQRLSRGDEAPRSLRFRGEMQPMMRRLSWLVAREWELPEAVVVALRAQAEPGFAPASSLGEVLERGILLGMLHGLNADGRVAETAPYLASLSPDDRPPAERALAEIDSRTGAL